MNSHNISVSLRNNNLEHLESGSLMIRGTELDLDIDTIKIKFSFLQDSKGIRYEGNVIDGVLYFKLYNFKNTLGEGVYPVKVGTLRGRELYLGFHVHSSLDSNDSTGRIFNYYIMLGGNVD